VISTSYKAGTTWMQHIVGGLIHGPGTLPAPMDELSPWIDARFLPVPLTQVVAALEAQPFRRFLKSHLPLDALPYDARVKYVFVGRDGRDVLMSFWNHYGAYTDTMYSLLNGGADFAGEPLPRCPTDIHACIDGWLHRGSFPWEQDGWPMWSHLHHAQSFWNFRHLPNLHFVHYADLKADREREMRRLAAFLGITVPEADWPALVERVGFEEMKRAAAATARGPFELIFQGGTNRFFFRGTNGRWKDVMTPAELAEYDAVVARALTPDCAAWLERGRAAGDPKQL
jgi:aryl sulfotransferase